MINFKFLISAGCLAHAAFCVAADTVRVHMPMLPTSTEAKAPPTHTPLVLRLNIDDLRHVLIQPDDLKSSSLTVKVNAAHQAGTLALYRLTKDVDGSREVAAGSYDPAPLAKMAFDARGGAVVFSTGLTQVIRDDLTDPNHDHGLLLKAEPDAAVELASIAGVVPAEPSNVASLSITITKHPNVSLFNQGPSPAPGVFTQVQDGHLMYGNERLKLWGVCRHFWGGAPVIDRLNHMGFNAIRLWGPRNAYTPASAHDGVMVTDEGSLDEADSFATFDKFFADAKARGFFIVMAGLHYDPLGIMQKGKTDGLEGIVANDSFIAKEFGAGADFDAWSAALRKMTSDKKGRTWHEVSQLTFFDLRLREIYRRQVVNLLNHVNPYTQKRYADDEAVAEWELNNEQGLGTLTTMYGNSSWPKYFQNEIQSQWNAWLRKQYATDDALKSAWGSLKLDETLAGDKIAFAPMLHQRTDYPAARAADLVHFFCDITDSFNQQMRTLIRQQAKPGTGANVIPVVFDTMSEPSGQWMYTESLGDAMSFGTYQFTFHSALTVPPALFIMDNQTVWHKPTIIYETQSIRPGPFRAEYPLRVAALAGWQDWDGVFFHYWKGEGGEPDETYQATQMDLPRKGYMDGGVYPDQDPAYCASLAIAGCAFRSGAIASAPKPVVYRVPITAVYGYDTEHGLNMRNETFARGASTTFIPTGDVAARPPSITAEVAPAGAVVAGRQIVYDWPNGRMMIDTPTMKAYVGQPHGAYRFSDGIVLEQVSTPFVAFAMVSADGKPLVGRGACDRVYITAHFDARNSGFRMRDVSMKDGESSGWDSAWSDAMAAEIISNGVAPAVADPVAYQVDFPTMLDGHIREYDFSLRQKADSHLSGNTFKQDAGDPPFLTELDVTSRGTATPTPPGDSPQPTDPVARGASNPLDRPDPSMAGLYMPVPRLGWGEGYNAVSQYLRDSTLLYSKISKELPDAAHERTLDVSQLTPLKDLPDLPPPEAQLAFSNHRLSAITLTFPAGRSTADQLSAIYSKVLGKPVLHTANETRWEQRAQGSTMHLLLALQNGGCRLLFETSAKP